MMKMEMNVGHLKECLQGLSDDMPVYVACNGECNCDFEKKRPREGADTFAIIHNGALFITDENAVEIGDGEYL